jgi:hypothetical protein
MPAEEALRLDASERFRSIVLKSSAEAALDMATIVPAASIETDLAVVRERSR